MKEKNKSGRLIAVLMLVYICVPVFPKLVSNPKVEDVSKPVDIQIVLFAQYPKSLLPELQRMQSEAWYDFYPDTATGEYYLQRADIHTEIDSYNECWDDSTITLCSARNSLFLIRGLKPDGLSVKTIYLPENGILTERNQSSFCFGGREYAFNIKVREGSPIWAEKIEVYFGEKDSESQQWVTTLAHIEDTGKAQVLWLGDLDRDGKPDFILDTSDLYEEVGVALYLSSAAENGEKAGLAATASYSTDC